MSRLWAEGLEIEVETSEHGKPLRLRLGEQWQGVERVCNRWRVSGEWWKGEAGDREYVKLVTDGGLLCVITTDVGSGEWVMVRMFD